MYHQPEYPPLNSSSELYDEASEDGALLPSRSKDPMSEIILQSSPNFTLSSPALYAFILLVALTILNGTLLPFTLPKYKSTLHTPQELKKFPYPTQGIGLDRAAKFIPQTPTWSRSWPLNIVRLSQSLKNAVYGDGVQVFISVEDSSVFRFRVPTARSNSSDCAVTWTAPPILSARAKDLHTKGDISEIEVWSIISPNALENPSSKTVKDLDFNVLSWNTRPIRGELLGTLDMSVKTNSTTAPFGCPDEDADMVIEMRCLRVACEIKFKQV